MPRKLSQTALENAATRALHELTTSDGTVKGAGVRLKAAVAILQCFGKLPGHRLGRVQFPGMPDVDVDLSGQDVDLSAFSDKEIRDLLGEDYEDGGEDAEDGEDD